MPFKKQRWIGTIPIFLFIISGIFGLVIALFIIGLNLFTFLNIYLSILLSLLFAAVTFLLILNIPIPRRRQDPTNDLNSSELIAEGAWCSVYQLREEKDKVIKQIYPCGWGHNDYTQHMAPVVGKPKICGKWNPLCLWVIHSYMVWYQMIGLRRRLKFEHQIDAIPQTSCVSSTNLRYEQPHIPLEFNEENCPQDAVEQFKLLNDQLVACGLYLDDVHARNVRVTTNGKIQIIDGELYAGGEEWIKSGLVKLFNGEVVSGMEKVLGNERIVAWVDHRQSVDDVVRNSKQ